MSNKFQNKFLKLLQEAPELDFNPDDERSAAANQIDDDSSLDDYNVDVDPDPNFVDEIGNVIARQNDQMIGVIDKWCENIDKFLNYINGDQSNSIQTVLAASNPESIIGNLKNQQYKIGRIASDLAALQQAFITAKKSQ
jgi:hypothetical protein